VLSARKNASPTESEASDTVLEMRGGKIASLGLELPVIGGDGIDESPPTVFSSDGTGRTHAVGAEEARVGLPANPGGGTRPGGGRITGEDGGRITGEDGGFWLKNRVAVTIIPNVSQRRKRWN